MGYSAGIDVNPTCCSCMSWMNSGYYPGVLPVKCSSDFTWRNLDIDAQLNLKRTVPDFDIHYFKANLVKLPQPANLGRSLPSKIEGLRLSYIEWFIALQLKAELSCASHEDWQQTWSWTALAAGDTGLGRWMLEWTLLFRWTALGITLYLCRGSDTPPTLRTAPYP